MVILITFPTPSDARRLTSAFGWRTHPVTGVRSFHYGIDLAPDVPGTTGVPVFACQDGIVRRVQTGTTEGLYLRIEHTADTYMSQYLHLASALVSVDDVVIAGQQIGVMGMTGRVTGIHLDFGVSTSYPPVYGAPGTFIDPLIYLDYAIDPPENPEWPYPPGWDPEFEWDEAFNVMIRSYKNKRRR